MSQHFRVREYRPEDRASVRQICFETGLMGAPISAQYRDLESFADLFSAYYTDVEPHNAFVATLEGKVIGYTLGCLDTRRAWNPLRTVLRHVLTRGVCFRPGTSRFYARGLIDSLVDLGAPKPHTVDLERYPSHTHHNLLSIGRGQGLGKLLLLRVFERLVAQGSVGVHIEVMSQNAAMLGFAQALGYERDGAPYQVPGTRTADGKRVSVQALVRDLRGWEPSPQPQQLSTLPRR